jgi:hypothetical protein
MAVGTEQDGGIVVEDGTGYSNSDSLISVADASAYLLKIYPSGTWAAASLADQGAALRQATMDWFEGQFQGAWRGSVSVQDQFLSVPRMGLYDDEGRTYDSNEIPERMRQAVALVANDILINGKVVLPTGVNRSATVTEETSRIGTMSKTTRWSDKGNPSDSTLIVYRKADALVYTFVTPDGDNQVTLF